MIVYIYNHKWFYKYYSRVFKFFNIIAYSWERHSGTNFQPIKFPPISNYYDLVKEGRQHLENYFVLNIDKIIPNKILRDYIAKSITHEFVDYFIFRKAISQQLDLDDKIKIISPTDLKNIYENKKVKKNYFRLFIYARYIISFSIYIIKRGIIGSNKNSEMETPDVMYLRKKVYPDMLDFKLLKKEFENIGLNFGAYYLFPSKNESEKYGIYFLNILKDFGDANFLSVMGTIKTVLKEFHFFLFNSIDRKIFHNYIFDVQTSLTIVNLNPKVIFGILTDKPLFILLSKYKKNNQKISTFTDGFSFPPILGADYCYADEYYSMNDIESSTVNFFGGKFNSIKNTGSLRQKVANYNSSGISNDLKKLIESYQYIVTVTTSQINPSIYYNYDIGQLNTLINKIIDIAEKNKDILFIIKEKKGELISIYDKINLSQNTNNIFIIKSKKPRLLSSNQFENLLGITDLTISFTLNSMTIIQSIYRNIPVIVYNEQSESCFWGKNFESSNVELEKKILYWRESNKKDTLYKINKLKNRLNINNHDTLKTMVNNINGLCNKN